jgi:hypothetical protein
MIEDIKKLLEDGETLLGVTSPINLVLIQRVHDVTPFIIKGYDPKRNEFFEKFAACVDLEVAKSYMNELAQVSMMYAAKMGGL